MIDPNSNTASRSPIGATQSLGLDALSWSESSARARIEGLLDAKSFKEFLGPEARETSPHLALFDLPAQFDDGMVVGEGTLNGQPVLIAAQEGKFMGGAFGEVHGAKLTGLLRAAVVRRVPVVIAFETGGVRLQEANAGEVAIAEIMRAVIDARLSGIAVVGLIGGRAGCYGGGSLIAGTCSALAISELGRLSVSGPEVIETNRGVEAFDASDRPLIWRTMGGKHRYLLGAAQAFVSDTVAQFRSAAIDLLAQPQSLDLARLHHTQVQLTTRLAQFGAAGDATDVWQLMGVDRANEIPDLDDPSFLAVADNVKGIEHDKK